jgi:hypothetical protein
VTEVNLEAKPSSGSAEAGFPAFRHSAPDRSLVSVSCAFAPAGFEFSRWEFGFWRLSLKRGRLRISEQRGFSQGTEGMAGRFGFRSIWLAPGPARADRVRTAKNPAAQSPRRQEVRPAAEPAGEHLVESGRSERHACRYQPTGGKRVICPLISSHFSCLVRLVSA